MLARIQKSIQDKEEGFTLIELLVVMIIIGILAAIAIPTFLNQRKNGYRSALKADLKNAATAIESAAVDQQGDFSAVVCARRCSACASKKTCGVLRISSRVCSVPACHPAYSAPTCRVVGFSGAIEADSRVAAASDRASATTRHRGCRRRARRRPV